MKVSAGRSALARRSAWVFACLLGSVCWATAEQPAEQDWTVDNSRWKGTLAPATAIEVRNPYGDVRLRPADAAEVEASAMMQRRKADPAKAELVVEPHGATLRIEVRYPQPPQGNLHRVDVAVFVPAGATVTARTADGMIQARGLANDLDLASDGGDVAASTTGTAHVEAGRGDVSVELRSDGWSSPPRLAAVKVTSPSTFPRAPTPASACARGARSRCRTVRASSGAVRTTPRSPSAAACTRFPSRLRGVP